MNARQRRTLRRRVSREVGGPVTTREAIWLTDDPPGAEGYPERIRSARFEEALFELFARGSVTLGFDHAAPDAVSVVIVRDGGTMGEEE